MMRALLLGCVALLQLTALAQPVVAVPQPPIDVQDERSRIQAERSREAARYAQQERACYARFAVNDCLAANRAQRRGVLDDLRRQTLALDSAERKSKALDQIERIRDKTAIQDGRPAAP
jgi:colicin import membrane protein